MEKQYILKVFYGGVEIYRVYATIDYINQAIENLSENQIYILEEE